MTKTILTFAIGAAGLLVSCEPLPVYPRTSSPYGQPQRGTNQMDRYSNPRNQAPPVQDRAPTQQQVYPVAERTDNPNQVLSPYTPYNVIDVEGFRSGQLVKDPSNGRIFRIP